MIDLHCHSTYSDGKLSLIELLKIANEKKLEVFSITDHNNIDAHIEASNLNIKDYFEGEFIAGCEFNCMFEGIRIELLGYNFNSKYVQKWLDINYKGEKYIKDSLKQFEMLFEKCKKLGIKIDENLQYNPLNEFPMNCIHYAITKHPENILIIGEDAFYESNTFYRMCTTNEDYILYCDFTKYTPDAKDVSALIKNNGGLVFFAHPYGYKLSNYNLFIDKLIHSGLVDGLECFHSGFSGEQTQELINYCNINNLYISGGSDFHSFEKTNYIGTGFNNNLNISINYITNWYNKKQ